MKNNKTRPKVKTRKSKKNKRSKVAIHVPMMCSECGHVGYITVSQIV